MVGLVNRSFSFHGGPSALLLGLRCEVAPMFISRFCVFIIVTLFVVGLAVYVSPSSRGTILVVGVLLLVSIPCVDVGRLLTPMGVFLVGTVYKATKVCGCFNSLS